MKRLFYIILPVLMISSFFVFSWHLQLLPSLATSNSRYFINRLIMALWLAIPGFALELPRLWPYFSGKAEAHTDWWFLLWNGVPAFFFAWLPFFVAVGGISLPGLLVNDPSMRLAIEALGAFWLGISLGKSIVLD